MRLRPNLLIGGTLLGFVFVVAATALVWTPYDPVRTNLRRRLVPPSSDYWLGTDEFGRDVASRLMEGAVTSLTVAASTVLVALVLGMAIGLAGGFLRGWTDRILGAINDTLLAFPGIVLALGLAYAPSVARVVRGTVLSIREREFVEASRALGNSELYTLMRHVLPHTAAPVTVLATSLFGWVILSESALSFLGLGVPPPAATWGNMLASARPFMQDAPILSIAPGVMIATCLLGVNLLGDALRDLLDPRDRA